MLQNVAAVSSDVEQFLQFCGYKIAAALPTPEFCSTGSSSSCHILHHTPVVPPPHSNILP
jgi:hypothetical protein